MVSKPAVNNLYDRIHQWPEFGDKRNGCRLCSMLSFVYSFACQVYLCLQKERT